MTTPHNAHSDSGDLSPGRRDAEKRWSDPAPYRAPVIYTFAVIVLALAALALFAALGGDDLPLAAAVPGVFGLGGLGALGAGIAAYRRDRSWMPWQGSGWFLLVLMLATLGLPYAAR